MTPALQKQLLPHPVGNIPAPGVGGPATGPRPAAAPTADAAAAVQRAAQNQTMSLPALRRAL